MNKILSMSLAILALIGIFLLFYNRKPIPEPVPENTLNQNTEQRWEPKTDEQTSINVTITPVDLSVDSQEWKFDVTIDTHSVELDQDMTKSAVLMGDDDEEYKPIRWEGPTGGHHREGTLLFAPIAPYPQHLKLIINGIGGVQRYFEWILSN